MENMKKEFNLDFSFDVDNTKSTDESITIKGWANREKDDLGNEIIDRDGDVVLSTAYDMENFKKNAIILYQHDRHTPIGVASEFSIGTKGLEITATIYKDMSKEAYVGIKNGILKTFSIGFRGKDGHYNPETDVFYYTDVELHEVSVVSIPANQDSLFSVEETVCPDGNCMLAMKNVQKALGNKTPSESILKKLKDISEKLDLLKEEPEADVKPEVVEEPEVVSEEPEVVSEEPEVTPETDGEPEEPEVTVSVLEELQALEVTDENFEELVALVEGLEDKLDAKLAEALNS